MLQESLRSIEGRENIGLKDSHKMAHRRDGSRSWRTYSSGIVDQDIDLADLPDNRLKRFLNLFRDGHVGNLVDDSGISRRGSMLDGLLTCLQSIQPATQDRDALSSSLR